MNTEVIETNRRVIIIDDNPAIHADFRKILAKQEGAESEFAQASADLFGHSEAPRERAEFDLGLASQGQEGLAAVQETSPSMPLHSSMSGCRPVGTELKLQRAYGRWILTSRLSSVRPTRIIRGMTWRSVSAHRIDG